MMQILGLFGMDFDAATVFVTNNLLLVRLALVTLLTVVTHQNREVFLIGMACLLWCKCCYLSNLF